jgi:hypothetical protein
MRWMRSSTGNPKENRTPRSRQAAANACVAPAESERASTRSEPGSPGRGRACSSRKEFRDNGDLAVAVLDALREVAEEAAPLSWEPVDPEPVVRWLTDRPSLADRAAGYIPVLEVHLAAVTDRPVLPVSALEPLASRLGRAGRDAGLFTEGASVDLGADTGSAWAKSCADSSAARGIR